MSDYFTDMMTGDLRDLRDLQEVHDDLTSRRDDEDQADPLTEEEVAALVELDRFIADELGGDTPGEHEYRSGPEMIRDYQWLDFATETFDELVLGPAGVAERVSSYIDYDKWARDLAMDYSEVTLFGYEYRVRA